MSDGARVVPTTQPDVRGAGLTHGSTVVPVSMDNWARVVACPVGDHKLHPGLNGALNILRRGSGALVHGDLKPLPFITNAMGSCPCTA